MEATRAPVRGPAHGGGVCGSEPCIPPMGSVVAGDVPGAVAARGGAPAITKAHGKASNP